MPRTKMKNATAAVVVGPGNNQKHRNHEYYSYFARSVARPAS
ncbi:MAG TPA: hypothetical protein VEL47_01130 [Myxococcota bacterium]|nr:hypothetical protein [Myxococcota bacterium]